MNEIEVIEALGGFKNIFKFTVKKLKPLRNFLGFMQSEGWSISMKFYVDLFGTVYFIPGVCWDSISRLWFYPQWVVANASSGKEYWK